MTTLHRGDIVYIHLEKSKNAEKGEQAGDRFAVVIQNNVGNKNSDSIIVGMLTTQLKKPNFPTHLIIYPKNRGFCISMFLGEQIRTISKDRVLKKVGTLTPTEMQGINHCIKVSLGLQ